MASWRPPGSILEAPGSILEAPGSIFSKVRNDLYLLFWKVLERFFRDFWSECPESRERQERLPKQDLDHKSAKSGWAAVLPPGGVSIRRPPKVCQRRAELLSNWLCRITGGQSRHSFAQFDLKCSNPYPFLSPGAWGSPEPSSKKSLSVSCWPILVDFFAFRTALEK